MVTNANEATHTIMTKLTRTTKLLISLCVCKYIVSSSWIVESAKAGKFLQPENYPIHDKDFEEIFKCDIYKTIQQPNRNKLFEKKIFYLTPSVFPLIKNLINLIELSGGIVEKKRRSSSAIADTLKQNPGSYIIVGCQKDIHLLIDLAKVTKSHRFIYSTEYIMQSIMHQKIEDDKNLLNFF